MKKGFANLIILLGIVLLIVVAGAAVYQKVLVPGAQPTPVPVISPSPILTPTITTTPSSISQTSPTLDPTADWKTFTNKNKYVIKYPQTLTVFPEQVQEIPDPGNADGISIQGQPQDVGYNKALLKIYAVDPDITSYKFSSLKELAEINYKTNTENKNTFVRIINNLHESNFKDEKSFEYSIESKGFFGGWTGFLGEQGVIKIIVFTHNDKYFLIGYYDKPIFNQILSTFKFID